MLASNQPFQRVDDGIGAGLISGAVVGAAATYGMNRGMNYLANRRFRGNPNADAYDNMANSIKHQQSRAKWKARHASLFGGDQKLFHSNIHPVIDKVGGMSRRAAITAGLGVLAGSIIGASIDAMND
jgi:hypothetical protein